MCDMEDLSQCRLNYDILTLVAPYTSSPTLSTLMRTCRDAYDRYPRYILKDTAHLRDDENVRRFLQFMHVADFRRWLYLRSLHFTFRAIRHPQTAQRLARVLVHATHLERLTFDDSEFILAVDPALPRALAALPSVKHVQLQPGAETQRMLKHIVWSLEAAELWKCAYDPNFDLDLDARPHEERDWTPGLLFKNARKTLTSIATEYWWAEDPAPPSVLYPHVSLLTMNGVKYPNAVAWSAACPNVKRLSIYSDRNEDFRRNPTLELLYHERRRNADFAKQLTAKRWMHLDHYSGSLWDLYLSGIAGQITTIKSERVYVQELFRIPGLFERARPRHLELHVCPDPIAVDVPSLLNWAGMDELETLTLVVPMELQEDDASSPVFEKFMTDIVDGLC
ncbi:hypothetical protein C8Q80DRAFT_271992 [Daedaleopsis nitida]|nr:hypothetical protein C8Q80DRAFT_271992 [Daedaleopsis nitida]